MSMLKLYQENCGIGLRFSRSKRKRIQSGYSWDRNKKMREAIWEQEETKKIESKDQSLSELAYSKILWRRTQNEMKWIGPNFLKSETKRIIPIICRLEVRRRDLPNTFQDQKKNDQCTL
jgi:hypothetical protein